MPTPKTTPTSPTTPREGALWAIGLGLRIFPLRPRSKKPAIKDWAELATTDTDQVDAWWTENPDYNVGIVTGPADPWIPPHGLLVFDCDVDKETGERIGEATLHALEEKLGALPKDTPRVRSPSGGVHVYVPHPPLHQAPSSIRWREGMDKKCGPEGKASFIVGPGSVHPDGGVYTLENPDAGLQALPLDSAWERAVRGSFRLPDTIPEGLRNTTLYRYLSQVREVEGAGQARLLALGLEANGRCANPLPEEEIEQIAAQAAKHPPGSTVTGLTILDGGRFLVRVAGADVEIPDAETLLNLSRVQALAVKATGVVPEPKAAPWEWRPKVNDLLARAERVEEEATTSRGPETLGHLLDTLDLEGDPEPLLPFGLVHEGFVTLLFAPPKHGKSRLITQAIAEATQDGRTVLYVSEMSRRLAGQYLHSGKAHQDRALIVSLSETPPRTWEEIKDWVALADPDVIVLDTVWPLLELLEPDGAPDNSDAAAYHAISDRFRTWWASSRPGRGVLIVHQTRKDGESLHGSVGWRSGPDALIHMKGVSGNNRFRKLLTTGRGVGGQGVSGELVLRFTSDERYVLADSMQEPSPQDAPAGPQDLLSDVYAYVRDHPACTARQIEQGVVGRNDDIRDARKDLVSAGLLVNRGDRFAHAWHVADDDLSKEDVHEQVNPPELDSIF